MESLEKKVTHLQSGMKRILPFSDIVRVLYGTIQTMETSNRNVHKRTEIYQNIKLEDNEKTKRTEFNLP